MHKDNKELPNLQPLKIQDVHIRRHVVIMWKKNVLIR